MKGEDLPMKLNYKDCKTSSVFIQNFSYGHKIAPEFLENPTIEKYHKYKHFMIYSKNWVYIQYSLPNDHGFYDYWPKR